MKPGKGEVGLAVIRQAGLTDEEQCIALTFSGLLMANMRAYPFPSGPRRAVMVHAALSAVLAEVALHLPTHTARSYVPIDNQDPERFDG